MPAIGESLVGLALALQLCIPAYLSAALVEPAPRLMGQVSGAVQLDAGAFGLHVTLQQLLHGTGLMGSFPFLHMGLPQARTAAARAVRGLQLHAGATTIT